MSNSFLHKRDNSPLTTIGERPAFSKQLQKISSIQQAEFSIPMNGRDSGQSKPTLAIRSKVSFPRIIRNTSEKYGTTIDESRFNNGYESKTEFSQTWEPSIRTQYKARTRFLRPEYYENLNKDTTFAGYVKLQEKLTARKIAKARKEAISKREFEQTEK